MAPRPLRISGDVVLKGEVPFPKDAAAAEVQLIQRLTDPAVERAARVAWRVAVEIAPIAMVLADFPEDAKESNIAPATAADIDGEKMASVLLGEDAAAHARSAVAEIVQKLPLLFVFTGASLAPNDPVFADGRVRRGRGRRVSGGYSVAGYVAMSFAPYTYVCCAVSLGLRELTDEEWALSEIAHNPDALLPRTEDDWRKHCDNWRKRLEADQEITIAKVRADLERELGRQRN